MGHEIEYYTNQTRVDMSNRPSGYQGYFISQSGSEDSELTHVDRETPCGEYLRRYWQPVAMSSELKDLPLIVEILDEQLVLFRDKSGQLGLLHRHCAHRGASLEYGIIADKGIICCYHGWHYDVDGCLLKAGSEREDNPVCKNIIQGAYPVHEYMGIIFAYLGPPESKPEFPIFDTQEIEDTEHIPFSITTPCNWLQVYENTQDPIHVLHLHARSSGVQFGVASGVDQTIEYMDTPLGMINIQARQIDNHIWVRTTESFMPNGNQTGAIFEEAGSEKIFQRTAVLRWMVPVNNTMTRTIGWRFFRPELDPGNLGDKNQVGKEKIDFIGQTEEERPYEERQRQPGDYEAQVSQRPIAIHALENYGRSDAGVFHLRKMIRKNILSLRDGNGVRHPQATAGTINTYTQDSVLALGNSSVKIKLEEKNLREIGREIAKTVVSSGSEPSEQRQRIIRKSAQQALGCLNQT